MKISFEKASIGRINIFPLINIKHVAAISVSGCILRQMKLPRTRTIKGLIAAKKWKGEHYGPQISPLDVHFTNNL